MSNPYGPQGAEHTPSQQGAEAPVVNAAHGHYLPPGLPIPVAEPNGLSRPYWDGLREEKIMVQRNPKTGVFQFPPQWICHDTQTFDVEWVETEPRGRIYSWTRSWHPVHPALKDACPYIIVVVELPNAGGVRMLGNLLGDPRQRVPIGAPVEAVFEHHNDANPPFTLLQWRVVEED
jgi:uncharacterized OB-fold protein